MNFIDFLTTAALQNKHNLFKCCTYLRADLNSLVASNEVNERRHIVIKLPFTNFDNKRIKKINVVYNYAITHVNDILTVLNQ